MSSRVWFITGCSTGFGRCLAEEVLKTQDKVVVTARKIADIADFEKKYPGQALCLPLDVTKIPQVNEAVVAAEKRFGKIDILVNNAGYGMVGAFEESPDSEIRRMFETNVFGLMNVTRAVLPKMRELEAGHIVNISSVAGFAATAGFGIYNSSKFAVEGFSDALALELKPLGIKVTIVEPGPFRTDFAGRSITKTEIIPDYEPTVGAMRKYIAALEGGNQAGDPVRAAELICKLATTGPVTMRMPLGTAAIERMRTKLKQVEADIHTWEADARSCDRK